MRTITAVAIFLLTWFLYPTSYVGSHLPGIRDAFCMDPPSVKERREKVSDKDQEKDAAWFGRKGYTKGGRFCECGVSRTDPNDCYHPKQGQYCCHPKTEKCHIVKTTKWNVPFVD